MDEELIDTHAGVVRVRRGAAGEVIDLRHRILRAGLPRETAMFDGDDHPDARHVVAAAPDGTIVGCATLHASVWRGEPAFQLRGMATEPAFQGAGVGGAMLAQAERLVFAETAVRRMWCNARLPAVGFYERLGWRVVSEVFEIPTAGPHVKMTKSLSDYAE
jgi:predicted GNAT family N-acyltransferase